MLIHWAPSSMGAGFGQRDFVWQCLPFQICVSCLAAHSNCSGLRVLQVLRVAVVTNSTYCNTRIRFAIYQSPTRWWAESRHHKYEFAPRSYYTHGQSSARPWGPSSMKLTGGQQKYASWTSWPTKTGCAVSRGRRNWHRYKVGSIDNKKPRQY